MRKELLGLTAGVLLTGVTACDEPIEPICNEFSIRDLDLNGFLSVDDEVRTDSYVSKIVDVCLEPSTDFIIGSEIGDNITLNAGTSGDNLTTTVLISQADSPRGPYDLPVACIQEGETVELILGNNINYFNARIVEVCPQGL